MCFKKQTELSCCGSCRLSGYLERNDSQATQERGHLLFPGQSRSQRVLRRVCHPFIYLRKFREHLRLLKGLWLGDWRPFWGDMEAIRRDIQVLYYGIRPWRRILNGACISISNLPEIIAWQTHKDDLRPEARGPLKSGAWSGRSICHPQTPVLTISHSIIS